MKTNGSEFGDCTESNEPCNDRHQKGIIFRRMVVEAGKEYQTSHWRFAELLTECHAERYWAFDYKSFEEYVDDEVGIKLRTAQELMKVWKICQQYGISTEQIEEAGWSKLALVASSLNSDNVQQVLKKIEKTSYSALKAEQKKQRQTSRKREQQTEIVMTDVIARAMRLAAARSHDLDTQGCLEHIAQYFLDSASFRSNSSRRFEWN